MPEGMTPVAAPETVAVKTVLAVRLALPADEVSETALEALVRVMVCVVSLLAVKPPAAL
jgi:hypothetical protein